MNLSSLFSDCQMHLFNRMYLSDHFRLRATCRSLNTSFITNAATRHSLVLKIGHHEKVTDYDDLVCPTLNREICDYLLGTFPSITHLQIRLVLASDLILHYPHFLKQIVYLLDGWSGFLKSLKFFIDVNHFIVRDRFCNLQFSDILPNSLNSLPALKVLHLLINTDLPNSWFNLPILGQLEEFSFKSLYIMEKIYNSLVNYALPNENLRTITLHKMYFLVNQELVQRYLNLDASFTRKFTAIGDIALTSQQLADYAHKFTGLKYLTLEMEFNYMPLNRVSELLATNMHQLEYLILKINFNQFLADPQPCTSPVLSVKKLDLQMYMTAHTNIAKYLQPSEMFPNVELIKTTIHNFKCTDCQIDNSPTLPAARRELCRELLNVHLKSVPN